MTTQSPDEALEELILFLHRDSGERVVVLVDEYDKPILDNLGDPGRALEIRDALRSLYSVIKIQDAHPVVAATLVRDRHADLPDRPDAPPRL